MSELRYQSTGKPVFDTSDDAARLAEARRQAQDPRSGRAEALAAINRRSEEAMTVDHEKGFKDAINRFEYRHPDFNGKQGLLLRVAMEANELVSKAGRSGEVVSDWDGYLDKVADSVREKAGIPLASQQRREEALSGIRKSRGKDHG